MKIKHNLSSHPTASQLSWVCIAPQGGGMDHLCKSFSVTTKVSDLPFNWVYMKGTYMIITCLNDLHECYTICHMIFVNALALILNLSCMYFEINISLLFDSALILLKV